MELAPYFEAQNLEFSGISRNNYEQLGGQLPEGLYRFSFTVYDASRPDRQLSLPGQSIAWLALSEPPLLNQPLCGTEINIDDGQQFIVFQWSPISNSPNNANSVEYEFTLTEIRPAGRDPFEAWRTTQPIYRTTTTENSIVYDQDEPLLTAGLSYVWRVQAIDINGRESFREQGYSKVCEFKIAEVPLPPATNVIAEAISSDKGRVFWDLSPEAEGYEIQYRRSGDAGNQWFSSREPAQEGGSIDGEIVIPGLAPDREYEIRVGSRRDGFVSSWSNSAYFSTLEEQQLACGDELNFRPFENFQPLEFLYRGDVIETGGGMRVTVTASTGSNGSFSGEGVVTPAFIGVPIKVEFTNIIVDQDYRLTGGVIAGLRSPGLQEFIDAWDQDDGDNDDNQNGNGEDNNNGDGDTPPDPDIVIDGLIDEIIFDEETDEIVITDSEGNVTRHQQETDEDGEPTDTIITDSEGNTYLVDEDGNVSQLPNANDIPNPDGLSPQELELMLSIQDQIVLAVIDEFNIDIEEWLNLYGKGPLSEASMDLLEELPSCMPAVEEDLIAIQNDVLPEVRENKRTYVNAIRANEEARPFFDALGQSFESQESVDLTTLSVEDHERLREEVCGVLPDFESTIRTGSNDYEEITRLIETIRCAYVSGGDAIYINNSSTHIFNLENFTLSDGTVLSGLNVMYRKYDATPLLDNHIIFEAGQELSIKENDVLFGSPYFQYNEKSAGRIVFASSNESDLEKLISYLTPSLSDWSTQMNGYVKKIESEYSNPDFNSQLLKDIAFSYPCALTLIEDVNLKFDLIQKISTEWWIEGQAEAIVIDILNSIILEDEAANMIRLLENDQSGLLQALNGGIDNEEYDDYYFALTRLWLRSNKAYTGQKLSTVSEVIRQEVYDQLMQNELKYGEFLAENNVLIWSDPGYVTFFSQTGLTALDYQKFNMTQNGDVNFEVDHINWTGEDYDFEASFRAFDPVVLIALTSSKAINPFSTTDPLFRGQAIVIPAIAINQLNRTENFNTFMRTFDGITAAIPIGFALKSARYLYLGVEVSLFTVQQYMEDYSVELEATEDGRAILRTWMVCNLLYTVHEMGGGSKGLKKSFDNLIGKLDNYKGNGSQKAKQFAEKVRNTIKGGSSSGGVGTYSTKIKWGVHDIDARPLGDKGFWGTRIKQSDPRVEAFELKINPNDESFYVPHPNGGYVQFEGLVSNTLKDGKLIKQVDNSIYNVLDKPEFLRRKILDEAIRQTTAAKAKGLKVEWLVSQRKAVDQLIQYFADNNIDVIVKYLTE